MADLDADVAELLRAESGTGHWWGKGKGKGKDITIKFTSGGAFFLLFLLLKG
jgi:hypothetical protein